MSLELVDTLPGSVAFVSATLPATHLCPFRDEVDEGTITLSWLASGRTLELHGLREYVESLASVTISHEEYTFQLKAALLALGLRAVEAKSSWTTAGASVVVKA